MTHELLIMPCFYEEWCFVLLYLSLPLEGKKLHLSLLDGSKLHFLKDEEYTILLEFSIPSRRVNLHWILRYAQNDVIVDSVLFQGWFRIVPWRF